MYKILAILLVILAVVAVLVFVVNNKDVVAPTLDEEENNQNLDDNGAVLPHPSPTAMEGEVTPTPSPVDGSVPTPTPTPTPMSQTNTVTYSNSGYSPSTITVQQGQTVTWKNESSFPMWTASGIHPTHSIYPTIGGCIGSTFDACQGIASGETWSFRFDHVGTWRYHNHSNSSHTGIIIVE